MQAFLFASNGFTTETFHSSDGHRHAVLVDAGSHQLCLLCLGHALATGAIAIGQQQCTAALHDAAKALRETPPTSHDILRVGAVLAAQLLGALMPASLAALRDGGTDEMPVAVLAVDALAIHEPEAVLTVLHLRLESAPTTKGQWMPLLTLMGQLLRNDATLDYIARRRFPVLRHTTAALAADTTSDATRAAVYFVWAKCLARFPDVSAQLLQPATWDALCTDVARGSNHATRNLRTNALALLCALVKSKDALATPPLWPRLIDSLNAALASGDVQERTLACHLLLHVAQSCGQRDTMLARDVAEYCFEALAALRAADEPLLRRLLLLLVALASVGAPFGAHLQFGLECMGDAITSSAHGTPDTQLAGLQLLAALVSFPEAIRSGTFFQRACQSAALFASRVMSAADGVTPGAAWLKSVRGLLEHAALIPAPLLEQLQHSATAMLRALAATPVAPHPVLLAAAIRACGVLGAPGVALLHDMMKCAGPVVISHAAAAHELLATLHGIAEPQPQLFPVAFSAFFAARRALRLNDPALMSMAERFLAVARALAPWLTDAATTDALLQLPVDPEVWPEHLVQWSGDKAPAQLIVELLSCCAACGWSPLSDAASRSTQSHVAMALTPAQAVAAAVIFTCGPGWSPAQLHANATLCGALTRAILASRTKLRLKLPRPVLAWAFAVPALAPLAQDYARALIESDSLDELLALGHHLAPAILQIVTQPSTSNALRSTTLAALDALMQAGDEHAALMVMRGVLAALMALAQTAAAAMAAATSAASPHEPPLSELDLCHVYRIVMRALSCAATTAATLAAQQRADCLILLRVTAPMLSHDPSTEAHLEWLNCATTLATCGATDASGIPAWALIVPAANWRAVPHAILLGQLQLTGLLGGARFDCQLARAILDVITDESTRAVPPITMACLFVLRVMTARLDSANAEDGNDDGGADDGVTLHAIWATTLSLVMAPHEAVRLAAAECATVMMRDTRHAQWLVEKPWTLFCCRAIVAKLVTAPLGAPLPRSHVVFLAALVCQRDSPACLAPLLPPTLLARIVAECASCADSDDAVLLDLLLMMQSPATSDELRNATHQLVRAKIDRAEPAALSSATGAPSAHATLAHQDFGGARIYATLLWNVARDQHRPARLDTLYRLCAACN